MTVGSKLNLNASQQKVYNEISALLEENNNAVILIDTPSGTGKTYLLSALAATHGNSVKFIVFRKDQASELTLNRIESNTYISFCMHHFNAKYQRALHMFESYATDDVAKLLELIVYSKQFDARGIKTIVLDSYTIVSPSLLLLLYIVSFKNRINLIFAGHNLQLDAINKSGLHDRSNFPVIQMFNDITISKLSKNMRIRDTVLENSVSRFCSILRHYKSDGKVPFHFNLRYLLYTLFPTKYFTEERFDTVYMAQTHKNIKARLSRFIEYLKTSGTSYVEAPFCYNKNGYWVPIPPKRRGGRFLHFLILVEGYKYIYVNAIGIHRIVQLKKMIFVNNAVHSLQLRVLNTENDDVIEIVRSNLNYYQILPAYRTWLLTDLIHTDEIYQFPLRPYTLTYHAALGRTIEREHVELSTDCNYANFLYIGFSCVRHSSAIHKIHTERDLLGYVVTEYMEKKHQDFKYYYRCPTMDPNREEILKYVSDKETNEFIKNITWTDVDIEFFERKYTNGYLRIERSAYKQSDKEVVVTPLMKIAKFANENPDVIRKAIGMTKEQGTNVSNGSKTNKKAKKKQQDDAKQPAYVYLKEAYAAWTIANEKEGK